MASLFSDFVAVIRTYVGILFDISLGSYTLADYLIGLAVLAIVVAFFFRKLKSGSVGILRTIHTKGGSRDD